MASVKRCSCLLVTILLMVFTPTIFGQSVCPSSALTAYSSVQYITSPNYPNDYSSNTDCMWFITASLSSQVVVLNVIDFYLEGTSTYCASAYDYVTIYDGSSTMSTILQKLCGVQNTTQFVSTGSSMTVSFHSDESNNYRGFKFQYTSNTISDLCSGQSLTATSTISYVTSPNYPGLYPNNMDCTWVITASWSSQVIVLKFIDFYLEGTSTSCSSAYDYVTIYEGSSTSSNSLQNLCGTQTANTLFVSTGSSMTVRFHSNESNNYRGFKFQYTSSAKSDVCSGQSLTANSTIGYLTSPNYPDNYLNNMDCTWVITASLSSQVVVLNVIDFISEGTSTACYSAYDYVTIYDGSSTSSTSLQKLCGIPTTLQFVSTGSSITVSFHSDGSNTYRGFKFQYTSSAKSGACSAQSLTATSAISYLTSPNYPGLYPNNMDCTWVITASLSSKVVVLNIIDFYLEGPSTSCSSAYDYVTLYDGSSTSSTSLRKLCGIQSTLQFVSTGSSMTVRFHSDGSNNYSGFKLQYTSSVNSDTCSSSILTAYSSVQYITSPNYPNNYLSNTDCTWIITASLSSQVIVLKFIDFYLEGTSTSCYNSYDYVTIYDGSITSYTSLQRFCGTQTTTQFVSTGSSITVRFHSDGSNNYRGFKLQYTSNDTSDQCSSSALTAYSSAQYITSPNYPNNYLSNTDCTWVITASLSSQVVVLNVIDFYLEGTSTLCSGAYDYVTIYDGSSTSSVILQKLCGVQTTTQFVSTGSSMTVSFHSDESNNYRGFKLQYTSSDESDVCSTQSLTAYSTLSYLTSPNYPSFYPNNMNCEWHISASLVSYVVVLELMSLSLEGSGSLCLDDYVNVFDGSSKSSTQITSLCGTKFSGTYTSSGSYMTVVFHSDSSVQYSGFRFSYHSQEKFESSSSLGAGAIVGIVFCCIVVSCIIVAIVIKYRKHSAQQQIQNNPNRAQVETARTTTAAPAMSILGNNPPAVPAPYMMQNPPQMMPMGNPAYIPPPYSIAIQHGAEPHGQPPSGATGPSFVGAASTQKKGGHINKGFTGDSAPTVPSRNLK